MIPTIEQLLPVVIFWHSSEPFTRREKELLLRNRFNEYPPPQEVGAKTSKVRMKLIFARIAIAETMLLRGALLEKTANNTYVATDLGRSILETNPNLVTFEDLSRIEGWDKAWNQALREMATPASKRRTALAIAFGSIEEAQVEFPTPELFRVALVDDVHFGRGRFDALHSLDLLEACGVAVGDMDNFCISQVPSNRYKARTSDSGWSYIYTYRIPGKSRRSVRFKSEHGDGGVCDACTGPYINRRKQKAKSP